MPYFPQRNEGEKSVEGCIGVVHSRICYEVIISPFHLGLYDRFLDLDRCFPGKLTTVVFSSERLRSIATRRLAAESHWELFSRMRSAISAIVSNFTLSLANRIHFALVGGRIIQRECKMSFVIPFAAICCISLRSWEGFLVFKSSLVCPFHTFWVVEMFG